MGKHQWYGPTQPMTRPDYALKRLQDEADRQIDEAGGTHMFYLKGAVVYAAEALHLIAYVEDLERRLHVIDVALNGTLDGACGALTSPRMSVGVAQWNRH